MRNGDNNLAWEKYHERALESDDKEDEEEEKKDIKCLAIVHELS